VTILRRADHAVESTCVENKCLRRARRPAVSREYARCRCLRGCRCGADRPR
jgi:hypothetical protein